MNFDFLRPLAGVPHKAVRQCSVIEGPVVDDASRARAREQGREALAALN